MSGDADRYTHLLEGFGDGQAPTSPNTIDPKEPLGEEVRVPVEYKFKNPSFSEAITDLKVFVQGNPGDTAIITCHEVGLNHRTCFANFLSHHKAAGLLQNCCFYHIDLPGQSDGDAELNREATYPKLDQLGLWVGQVAKHFKLDYFFAIGAGAGANILTQYINQRGEKDPEIRGMLSISPMLETPSWREWGYDKVCRTKIWSSSTTLPAFVINQSLESFFGKQTHASNHARIQEFTESMKAGPKPLNYLALERMWVNRENLLTALKAKPPITVPTITVYGGNSFRSDHVVAVAGSDGVFKSKRSEMIEVWRGGDMVHEEDAGTVLTIFVTMLQGFSIIV